MPTLARYYIRTAFVWLVLAFGLGSAMLTSQLWGFKTNPLAALQIVFYHALMVGWVTQLIVGVAIWLFPVHTREQPRGNERIAWAAYITFNLGLGLRSVVEPMLQWQPSTVVSWAVVVAASLQVGALWLILLMLWPRVKGKAVKAK
ncbi:MAG TPA: hypothetical protein DEF47_10090 [Herpetosiphon sp.]|uniref:NnrS family protein n=1 Tax=Herpetosiphon aurantiacus (strain ATCC 23779 / DSM 785 / 114-95) TaxID=316274 RepID=A9B1Q7_HERA2|nr:hypothetical protein [Herpetosiphon sp.]ABX03942.1 conserved hypothetical protein [Herpetosiphon aurantiacus DSM 785]HBW50243.1 hypothetical protein [Herpetosiphon sp.]